jgi:hypothetical protein
MMDRKNKWGGSVSDFLLAGKTGSMSASLHVVAGTTSRDED